MENKIIAVSLYASRGLEIQIMLLAPHIYQELEVFVICCLISDFNHVYNCVAKEQCLMKHVWYRHLEHPVSI